MEFANLRLAEIDDIQLIRYWRNLDHVRNRMVVKDIIGFRDQRTWFKNNGDSNKFYVYSFGDIDIGCASITNIDINSNSFQGGIFCGDCRYLNHWINIWACIKIYNYAFNVLGLEVSYATILDDNLPAINLNKSIGYKFLNEKGDGSAEFILTKDVYKLSTSKIQRYLKEFLGQEI